MQTQAETIIKYLLEGRRLESSGAAGQMGGNTNNPNQMTPEMQEQMKQMMKVFKNQGK
ncbi:MAG: hypothetical protein JRF27_09135 [Deltaproteobacteria bacterium]|nr:hypothetical protein [Deltaproteobacteria bacterium]